MKKRQMLLAFLTGIAVVLGSTAPGSPAGQPLAAPKRWVARAEAVAPEPDALQIGSSGGGYSLNWNTFDDGGGSTVSAAGGNYQLQFTLGRPDARSIIYGGGFTLEGGFWPGTVPPWQSYMPAIRR